MKTWRKQDTAYLGATVAAVALAVTATFGMQPGKIEPLRIASIGHDLAAPRVVPLPTEHVRRVVRRVVVLVPSTPRIVVVTPAPTSASAPPKVTQEPTAQPEKKVKKKARNVRAGASARR